MDLDSLRILVDLAETKSFSKTAERSFMSQSAVSQRIRSLEQEFGHVLIERGKGRPGAQFSEAGAVVLAAAREMLARADGLRRELAELSGSVGGALRVATVYSIGLHALTPSLTRFLTDYPQVHLHLEYLRTDRIYEALMAGTIDCGIVAVPRERPHVEAVMLGMEPMVVILPPRHPLAAHNPLPPNLLDGQKFIAFDPDVPTRTLTDEYLKRHGVTVDVVQMFDNIETIKNVVEIGMGIAIVPEPTVRREIGDGSLVVRPLAGPPFTRPTGVLLRRGRTRSRALSRFLDVLTASENTEENLPGS